MRNLVLSFRISYRDKVTRKTKEVGVKKKFVNVAKCAIFIFFMTFYGFSAGEGFDRDANAFSFFCLSIVVIIVWVELKQTLFHMLGK